MACFLFRVNAVLVGIISLVFFVFSISMLVDQMQAVVSDETAVEVLKKPSSGSNGSSGRGGSQRKKKLRLQAFRRVCGYSNPCCWYFPCINVEYSVDSCWAIDPKDAKLKAIAQQQAPPTATDASSGPHQANGSRNCSSQQPTSDDRGVSTPGQCVEPPTKRLSATYKKDTAYDHHIDRQSPAAAGGRGMNNDSYDKEVETLHKSVEESEDYMGRKKTSLTEVIVERSDKEALKDAHRIYVM